MTIKVLLETNCSSCKATFENLKKAIEKSGQQIDIEQITDIQEIVQYPVWAMPAVIVDGLVVSVGKNLSLQQAEKLVASIAEQK